MTVPAKQHAAGDIMEAVITKGDLSKLTAEERVRYYQETCIELKLNPLTLPFQYIPLNGKLTLYATRSCTDQLRKINGVSLEIVSREVVDDILTVHVRARLPDGRTDEDLGAVPFPATLKGEFRANAELKAVTKAKRRATLSICGLGWLDETEVDDIPAYAKRPAKPERFEHDPASYTKRSAPNVFLHDPETGEVADDKPEHSAPAPAPAPLPTPAVAGAGLFEPSSEDVAQYDAALATAAEQGLVELKRVWNEVPDYIERALRSAVNRRHKPRAIEVDANRKGISR